MYRFQYEIREYGLHTPFRISRGVKTSVKPLHVIVESPEGRKGYGEGIAYARYQETPDSVLADIKKAQPHISDGCGRKALMELMAPGAARNALDCALWMMEGLPAIPDYVPTAQTIPLDTPKAMAKEASGLVSDILKIKLGSPADMECLEAVHQAAPDKVVLVDANEGWGIEDLKRFLPVIQSLGVEMIEQPLPADADDGLNDLDASVPIYADESARISEDLNALKGKYQGVNIKLDKTGGLTGARQMKKSALEKGFEVMIGCMVCTSLSIAPALTLIDQARWIDLDGAYWLEKDPFGPIIDFQGFLKGSGCPVRALPAVFS